VENPFQIAAQGRSLSGYERNRIFLNARGQAFYEISGLTGADSDGDGRGVVASDLNGDGMEDLLVRQAGGGSLLVFENRFSKSHWLEVSLRGDKSNRLGIGARLVVEVGPQKLVRELYPYDSFKSQSPARVHFGLGRATKVDRLTISWPSGLVQELTDLSADRHIRVREGNGEVTPLPLAAPARTAAAK
jgi:hypothetical protein